VLSIWGVATGDGEGLGRSDFPACEASSRDRGSGRGEDPKHPGWEVRLKLQVSQLSATTRNSYRRLGICERKVATRVSPPRVCSPLWNLVPSEICSYRSVPIRALTSASVARRSSHFKVSRRSSRRNFGSV
jgi:hypothetical protein